MSKESLKQAVKEIKQKLIASQSNGSKDEKVVKLRMKLLLKRQELASYKPIEPVKTPASKLVLQSLEPLAQDKLGSNVTLLLFYAYVHPEWNAEEAIRWAEAAGERFGMCGRLRVAREGFNGTLTGYSNDVRQFCQAMRDCNLSSNLIITGKPLVFANTDFKLTDNLPYGQAFPALKVFPVTEIVNYGLAGKQPSLANGGVHLNAEDYHEKMKQENTVIVDVRNTYEAAIGRFQPPEGGAEYIDPKMRVSTEFPSWVDANKEKLKGKQIMMFCTGGIRCERASALLRERVSW